MRDNLTCDINFGTSRHRPRCVPVPLILSNGMVEQALYFAQRLNKFSILADFAS
jgi:hypothetical protein